MGIQIRYGMVGGHMNAFIGEVHRKAIAADPPRTAGGGLLLHQCGEEP